jgi:ferredoxin--NADP+ reductase/benzoate/toluate 1,2-dioxygenase reductase subunit
MIEASPRAPAALRRKAGIHRVLRVRDLSPGAFVLRFSREGLAFRAGQWVNLGLPRGRDRREYTLYSSPRDGFLEVLVREIPEGRLSPALRQCRPGDELEVDGPYGSFSIVQGSSASTHFLFVATGTGVSPFHCFVRDDPGLNYILVHGVRDAAELYDPDVFAPDRYIPCISGGRGEGKGYAGRVTSWLAERPVEISRYCYLCGNSDMIYEVYALLRERGVPRSSIFAEVYF